MALIDELKERRDEALNSATGYDAKAKEFANYAADFRAEAEELGRAIAALEPEPEREYISDGEHERAASTLPPGATYIKGPYFTKPQPSPDVQQEDRQQEAQAIPDLTPHDEHVAREMARHPSIPEGFTAWSNALYTVPYGTPIDACYADGTIARFDYGMSPFNALPTGFRLPPEETAKDGEGDDTPAAGAPAAATTPPPEAAPPSYNIEAGHGTLRNSEPEQPQGPSPVKDADFEQTPDYERGRDDFRYGRRAIYRNEEYYRGWDDAQRAHQFPTILSPPVGPADGPSSQELQHEQTPSETNNQQEDSLKGEGEDWKDFGPDGPALEIGTLIVTKDEEGRVYRYHIGVQRPAAKMVRYRIVNIRTEGLLFQCPTCSASTLPPYSGTGQDEIREERLTGWHFNEGIGWQCQACDPDDPRQPAPGNVTEPATTEDPGEQPKSPEPVGEDA